MKIRFNLRINPGNTILLYLTLAAGGFFYDPHPDNSLELLFLQFITTVSLSNVFIG